MAKYAAQGADVTLVTATSGEEGEVVVPELAHLAPDRDGGLGEHRVGELTEACEALGVTDHRFLGGPGRYRDSGMMGTQPNGHPDSFWGADFDAAVRLMVDVVREVRPQVIVTYDANGFYGHPDHIQAHRVAWAAFEAAAEATYGTGEPWRAARFYATAMPRSALAGALDAIRAADTAFEQVESVDDLPFGVPDDQVTTEIDARDYLEAKLAAMRAHRSQIRLDSPFYALADKVGQRAFGMEYYTLLAGERGPGSGPRGRETDLFAGVL